MSDNSDQERRTRVDIQWFRALGAYPAVALGVEVSTAVGLFALLGPLVGLAGASAPSAFLLTALALFLPKIYESFTPFTPRVW